MKAFHVSGIFVSALALLAQFAGAQELGSTDIQAMQHPSSETRSLASLIEEAKSRNPQILAAGHAYKAAANVPK